MYSHAHGYIVFENYASYMVPGHGFEFCVPCFEKVTIEGSPVRHFPMAYIGSEVDYECVRCGNIFAGGEPDEEPRDVDDYIDEPDDIIGDDDWKEAQDRYDRMI